MRAPKRLPEHVAADEHHRDWNGEKGFVATTAAEGWLWGVALTASAEEGHCFLHGVLKGRDRSRNHHELHQAVWEGSHAPSAAEFRSRMGSFREWFESQEWSGSVRQMASKRWQRTDESAKADEYPGCRRTSTAGDRPRNRVYRLVYAGRGVHGGQASSPRRFRGWALLMNFRPFAKRSGVVREHQSPAHRLSGKR